MAGVGARLLPPLGRRSATDGLPWGLGPSFCHSNSQAVSEHLILGKYNFRDI